MASLRENLETRAGRIGEILAAGVTDDGQDLSEAQVTINGEVEATDAYVTRLYAELAQINDLLSKPIADTGGDGAGVPWEVRVRSR